MQFSPNLARIVHQSWINKNECKYPKSGVEFMGIDNLEEVDFEITEYDSFHIFDKFGPYGKKI